MKQMDWLKVIDALLVQAKELDGEPLKDATAKTTTHGILLHLAIALTAGLNDKFVESELDLDRMRNAMRRPMTEI